MKIYTYIHITSYMYIMSHMKFTSIAFLLIYKHVENKHGFLMYS